MRTLGTLTVADSSSVLGAYGLFMIGRHLLSFQLGCCAENLCVSSPILLP